ncbi:dienelactone hydrolase family protein [Mangrovimonas spongiae]|uniref:Alpha/beta hydrolase n=1 Tax=Mangrovimonas spongiae TaxID=2494697 RepID=A0A3R9UW57_9FLAO|nr:dienelactone hydrolase family protein [Mangrovimonas spongiae]RSK41407.1 alpha/beta hydrolase [Mangrovimonas spongiae]
MTLLVQHPVLIRLDAVDLKGILTIPEDAKGLVIFSHGSGSSRLSPRNTFVSNMLNNHDFATLLFDLLTAEEDTVYDNRFNIQLLTDRLIDVTNWTQSQPYLEHLPIGYFGASTGAASALNAAGSLKTKIKAVVSRGGRPDLADETRLQKVDASVLLIVGGKDEVVIQLNQKAFQLLHDNVKLEIIPQATHLFSEPGKLEQVTSLSINWFEHYLTL